MRGMVFGVSMVGVMVSSVVAQPSGEWVGCAWDGTPAAINAVAVWDINGDGTGAVAPFLATDSGVYSKGLTGPGIQLAFFSGSRVTSIATWDRDGDGPMTPELVVVVQDSLFMPAEVYSVVLGSGGAEFSLLAIFDSDVRGLTSYDTDGDGVDELVAVGAFESVVVDGVSMPMTRSAVFDGTAWSQLGTAPNSACEVATVVACSPADSVIPCEGDSTLVIGGFFTQAGGQTAEGIACWDDSAGDWGPCTVGTGLSGTTAVREVVGWDSDEGPQLIVGGVNIWVDGVPSGDIVRYDGASWVQMSGSTFGSPNALATCDVDGDGVPEPVMAGLFNQGGSFPYLVAYWDGSDWVVLDGGQMTSGGATRGHGFVQVDSNARGAARPALMVVGHFDTIDGVLAENLAIWTPEGVGGPCNDADYAEPFGSLNFFDVSAFLMLFAAQDPAADLNSDGSWDFFDVQVYITAFGQGCP